MIISILLILLGFFLLIKGADYLVDGASNLAKRFHIPEMIIGLTIVSIGTSMPELFVSITSALDGYPDMAVGNVIGSNIANLLLILGCSAIIRPIPFKKNTVRYDIPFSILITVLLYYFANNNNDLNTVEGFIFISIFLVFIVYTIIVAKSGKSENKKSKKSSNKKSPLWKDLAFMVGGIVALKFGGDLTIDNAVAVAKSLNWSEKLISVTILAIGTSLPELVTSTIAAKKGESDIAIGNIIGSGIFNILLILGISSLIQPITYNVAYNRDLIILIISLVILFIYSKVPPKNKMSRMNGLFYLLMYFGYLVLLFFA